MSDIFEIKNAKMGRPVIEIEDHGILTCMISQLSRMMDDQLWLKHMDEEFIALLNQKKTKASNHGQSRKK